LEKKSKSRSEKNTNKNNQPRLITSDDPILDSSDDFIQNISIHKTTPEKRKRSEDYSDNNSRKRMKSNITISPNQTSSGHQRIHLPIKKEKEEIIPIDKQFSLEDRESTPVEAYLSQIESSQTNEEEEHPSQDFSTIMTKSGELEKSSLLCSSGKIRDFFPNKDNNNGYCPHRNWKMSRTNMAPYVSVKRCKDCGVDKLDFPRNLDIWMKNELIQECNDLGVETFGTEDTLKKRIEKSYCDYKYLK